ncbi:MAG TPA: hypothetical protein VJV75_03740 [Candidatus Polarisedimenticolia bacterium]|nr:hypothetical protein [Candidatus Polarisedimenticolia bacterium]
MNGPVITKAREIVLGIGIIPILVVVAGLTLRIRWLTAIGLVWGAYSLLFSQREINATVTAGDPTITYPGSI